MSLAKTCIKKWLTEQGVVELTVSAKHEFHAYLHQGTQAKEILEFNGLPKANKYSISS